MRNIEKRCGLGQGIVEIDNLGLVSRMKECSEVQRRPSRRQLLSSTSFTSSPSLFLPFVPHCRLTRLLQLQLHGCQIKESHKTSH